MMTAGTIDTSFITGVGFDEFVYIIKTQSDGKILVGGNFTSYDNVTANYLIRLNADGSIDTTFNYGAYLNSYVRALEILPDGRIAVGGDFTEYNGSTTNRFIILNSDGSVSQYFPFGFDGIVRVAKAQSDGKILIGGGFANFNSNPYANIIRLNSNGTPDTTFTIGDGFNDQVFSIQIENSGDILIGGDFTRYDNIVSNYFIKLNTSGTILNTYGLGFDGRVHKIIIQSDGKLLLGGQFSNYNGESSSYMIRITSSGLIDRKFSFDSWVIDMYEQLDGRIIVGGQFNTIDGYTANYIVRLNPSGSIDGSFYQGSGFNDYVNAIAELQNGNILIGGRFTEYDNETYNYLIALNNDVNSYQYQYVYSGVACDLTQGIVSVLNPVYYIFGSNVEVKNGATVSVHIPSSPSRIQCVNMTSDFNIASEVDSVFIEEFNDCEICWNTNTVIALVESCSLGIELGIPVVISNQYNIGDIIYIPELIFDIGGGEAIYKYNDCFTILDIAPFEIFPAAQNSIIDYTPKQSCDECIQCNGKYYSYTGCTGEEIGYVFSYQPLAENSVIYFQTGDTPCKIVSTVVTDIEGNIYPLISTGLTDFATFSGCPVIYSTLVFNDCNECIYGWSENITYNGYIDYTPVTITPNWLLVGSDSGFCPGGAWTYLTKQFFKSGSMTFYYYWSTPDGIEFDHPFYYVSPNQPSGDTNVDFYTNIFVNSDIEFGSITINYNAGDWVSIGVFSTDCEAGPGFLYIQPLSDVIGPDYITHSFDICNGQKSVVNIPFTQENLFTNITNIPYSKITNEGLDEMPIGERDDDFIEVAFPSGFSPTFLCNKYESVFMSTNGYITFGGGNSNCCFAIPSEIPDNIGLPGIFISTTSTTDPMDDYLFNWYSGLTDGGTKFVIRFEGTYLGYQDEDNPPPFIYSFVFYENQEYFDLVIERNTHFYNDNPTGGISNGIFPYFLSTFNSGSRRAYRFNSNCTSVIKSNIGDTPAVCGVIGEVLTGITINSPIYYSDANEVYQFCEDCNQLYGATLKKCGTNEIVYVSMTKSDIDLILSQISTPIFKNDFDCYELLDYCLVPNQTTYKATSFHEDCQICAASNNRLANPQVNLCLQVCVTSGGTTVVSVNPPHPVWTDANGFEVTEMNAITLGGMYGLNN